MSRRCAPGLYLCALCCALAYPLEMISLSNLENVTARYALLLPAVWMAGCATVDAGPDYERAATEIERAVGHPSLDNPEDSSAGDAATAALLEGGLTAEESVKLALLNNPRARAVLLKIGMARADVVQAGLWSNPTVGFSFRFPDGGGLANFEASLAQNIAELWMIPARSRAAERDLARMTLDVARELVTLAIDTKVAYFNAVAADDALMITRDNVSLTMQLRDITEARLEAGTVGSLDVNLARGQALRAEVELRTATLESETARRTLATLMGMIESAKGIELTDPLPLPPERSLQTDRYVEIALDARLDARAARDAVEAAAARVELEQAKVFPNLDIGLEIERGERRSGESHGTEALVGPSLGFTVPLFDQNQAQIAKARMVHMETQALLDALERSIMQETRDAADRLASAWDVASLYQQQVLPQVQETLSLSEATYQAGQTTVLNVIDAQRSLLETRRANLAALQDAANAMAELERATARPVGELLAAADLSEPAAATQPSEEE